MPVLYFLGGLIAFVYVGVPLMTRFKLRLTGPTPVTPVAPQDVPEPARGFFDRCASALTPLGFDFAGYFLLQAGGQVRPFEALWINRATAQTAQANFLHGLGADGKQFLQF